MIKGVSRRIVEVRFPESVYFEKAVVFLRAGAVYDIPERAEDEARMQISALESGIKGMPAASRAAVRLKLLAVRIGGIIFKTAVVICAAWVLHGCIPALQ